MRANEVAGHTIVRQHRTFLDSITLLRDQLDDPLADHSEVRAQANQHLRGNTLALSEEPKQNVLRADEAVTELQRFS
jgi:hypothetical protein